ncbi:MAG: biotin carboxylase N-terminal domain-containing protein, partial [Oscillospiraceae bacterium]
MFKKILIANRGEIALRIIRCCREMSIDTVAVYSQGDETALHTKLASEAVCIGGARAQESYLNMNNIISAAINTHCDAIHPGFGFLSENSDFARLCREYKICFIGPAPEVIDNMGNKSAARRLMLQNDVPVVPGSDGTVLNVEEALAVCEKIGYPVLIKASAGGGGRGMRKAFNKNE